MELYLPLFAAGGRVQTLVLSHTLTSSSFLRSTTEISSSSSQGLSFTSSGCVLYSVSQDSASRGILTVRVCASPGALAGGFLDMTEAPHEDDGAKKKHKKKKKPRCLPPPV